MMENHKGPENKAIDKNLSDSIEEPHPHVSTSPGIKHSPSELQEEYKKIKEHVHEDELQWDLKLAMNFEADQSKKPTIMSKNPHFPFQNYTWFLNPEPVKNDTEMLDKKTIFEANDASVQRPCVTEPRKSSHHDKVFADVSNTLDLAEKELRELRKMKMDAARLKKAVELAERNLLKKKRSLILSKKALEGKEKKLLNRFKLNYPNLDKPDTGDSQKGYSECDLIMMRFNEVSLRSSEVRFNVSKVLQPAGTKAVKKSVKAKKLIEALMSKPSCLNSGMSSDTNQQ